ncbi:MAG: hypothetical protein CR957_00075 [Gammaproteobacteria bacterium]|nr:MAG: hypothetical protein CR957_00075 [Gammaproteobacteria bacterium]
MNFIALSAKFQRLYDESPAWRLLRADNAPFILAFIVNIFSDSNEVPYSQARILLEEELSESRAQGIWQTETPAGTYLNQWIRQGWLREMDDKLSKTDAVETVIRFTRGFEERPVGTSASHLRIVQDAVRDFSVAISESVDERLEILENKKDAIQREIDALNAGVVNYLSENQRRERIREIYQLASQLTGDFRLLEEETRQFDKDLRIQMIDSDTTRGDLLRTVLEKESLLAETDAGSAFEGFFQLLSDDNRSTEFREQLQLILSTHIANDLSDNQHQFLANLMRELSRESERIFHIRRRTEQELRAYIESGAAAENRAVDQLIAQLEKVAVQLRDADCPLTTATALSLPVGPLTLSSPDSMRLKPPHERLDIGSTVTHVNRVAPSTTMLTSLNSVQIRELAQTIYQLLDNQHAQSIADLVEKQPITSGLEELVAYLRIAKAVNATELAERETLSITDHQGIQLQATVPKMLMTAAMFPKKLEDLVL